MLDTNICIYIAKRQPASVLKKFEGLVGEEIALSSISYSELMYGVFKSQQREKNRDVLARLAESLTVVSYDQSAADHYGDIRFQLETRGLPIGSMDLLIAAHARSLGLTLVTNDFKDFERVENLKLENWV